MRPTPKASIRVDTTRGNNRGFFPKKTRDAMKRLRFETTAYKLQWRHKNYDHNQSVMNPIFTNAVKVTLVFAFVRPKSVSEHKRPYPSVTPDIDNLAKLTLDCLQPHILKDDCLIVTLHKRKIYAQEDYIDILVEDLL